MIKLIFASKSKSDCLSHVLSRFIRILSKIFHRKALCCRQLATNGTTEKNSTFNYFPNSIIATTTFNINYFPLHRTAFSQSLKSRAITSSFDFKIRLIILNYQTHISFIPLLPSENVDPLGITETRSGKSKPIS